MSNFAADFDDLRREGESLHDDVHYAGSAVVVEAIYDRRLRRWNAQADPPIRTAAAAAVIHGHAGVRPPCAADAELAEPDGVTEACGAVVDDVVGLSAGDPETGGEEVLDRVWAVEASCGGGKLPGGGMLDGGG